MIRGENPESLHDIINQLPEGNIEIMSNHFHSRHLLRAICLLIQVDYPGVRLQRMHHRHPNSRPTSSLCGGTKYGYPVGLLDDWASQQIRPFYYFTVRCNVLGNQLLLLVVVKKGHLALHACAISHHTVHYRKKEGKNSSKAEFSSSVSTRSDQEG